MKEKLLAPEPPLQLLPTLVLKLGVKEALILQQLHFRLLGSTFKKDGHIWYRHTYMEWQKQFPFYAERTISRAFLGLEDDNIIVSTTTYNPVKNMKTKWYRIDYEELYRVLEIDYDPFSGTVGHFNYKQRYEQYLESQAEKTRKSKESTDGLSSSHSNDRQKVVQNTKGTPITGQTVFELDDKEGPSIKIELKKERNKNSNVEKNLDAVAEIINYLNQKTDRNYRVDNRSTQRYIKARLKEKYNLDDFKAVIDFKVKQWLHDPKMKSYLRPSTLFNPSNFENYLIEAREHQSKPKTKKREIKPITLDFNLGEEDE